MKVSTLVHNFHTQRKMSSHSSSPLRAGGREASSSSTPPFRQERQPLPPSTSPFSAAAFQPPWALEAGRGTLSLPELAVVALGRLYFFFYALLRFVLVSLNVLPGPGGRHLIPSVTRLGGMPPRLEVAREAAKRVLSRVLVSFLFAFRIRFFSFLFDVGRRNQGLLVFARPSPSSVAFFPNLGPARTRMSRSAFEKEQKKKKILNHCQNAPGFFRR